MTRALFEGYATDNVIVCYMETHPYEQFPFAKLSKQFSKEQITLKPKQISHRWRNILDPRLSKESLSDKEKYYITSWIDETIINYMKNNETAEKPEKYPFAELSKIIHIDGIDAKKIADRWWNILDPRLCKEPLSQKEKKYIYSRVPQLIRPQQKINWKAGDGIEAGASNKADDNIEAGASNKASIDYMMN
ncbi:12728_t:CDS:2 [Funneliformis geosporum]|nr:12728_t:CDS:2 [Funneliformis geosporum]